MRPVWLHFVAAVFGLACAAALRPVQAQRPISPLPAPVSMAARDRTAPAAESLAAMRDDQFASTALRCFGSTTPVDGWALRCFIEEWLHRDTEGAIRAFAVKDGPLAAHAAVFLQLLAEHDARLAVETVAVWPERTLADGRVERHPARGGVGARSARAGRMGAPLRETPG